MTIKKKKTEEAPEGARMPAGVPAPSESPSEADRGRPELRTCTVCGNTVVADAPCPVDGNISRGK
jgi:hypothetical protein